MDERITLASHNDLNRAVEFDSPFRVHEDGTVTTSLSGVYGPSVFLNIDADGNGVGDEYADGPGWKMITGYSGQDRYAGPCMHPSEQLAGGMARAILADPGVYMVTTVECLAEDDGEEEHEPAGWVLLKRDDDAEVGA